MVRKKQPSSNDSDMTLSWIGLKNWYINRWDDTSKMLQRGYMIDIYYHFKLLISSISILHIREPKRRLSYLSYENTYHFKTYSHITYVPISASESSFKIMPGLRPQLSYYSHLFIEYLLRPRTGGTLGVCICKWVEFHVLPGSFLLKKA
jgi:hypothetical protein